MSKIYIGIDCGLDGGIASIGQNGEILSARIMPTVKAGKGRKIDIHTLKATLKELSQSDRLATLIIEDPGGHAPSAAGLRSMTYSFAVAETLAVAIRLPHLSVRAQAWQKTFWTRPKMPKGTKFNTKAAALSAACRIWPLQDWTKSARSTIPHDGMIDAALLAMHGRRNLI